MDHVILNKVYCEDISDDSMVNLPPKEGEIKALCDKLHIKEEDLCVIDFHFEDVDIEYIYDHSDIFDMEISEFLSTYETLKGFDEDVLSRIGYYMSSEEHNLTLSELLEALSNEKSIFSQKEFLEEIKSSMEEKEKQMFERFYNWIPPEERKNMLEAYYLSDDDEVVESEDFKVVFLK